MFKLSSHCACQTVVSQRSPSAFGSGLCHEQCKAACLPMLAPPRPAHLLLAHLLARLLLWMECKGDLLNTLVITPMHGFSAVTFGRLILSFGSGGRRIGFATVEAPLGGGMLQ